LFWLKEERMGKLSGSDLIHIRVGKGMKELMQGLIDSGMFSSEAEITREAIRIILSREEEFE
jgi:Arc/MetJ-type ribon-helix-helix transcriptional regulator